LFRFCSQPPSSQPVPASVAFACQLSVFKHDIPGTDAVVVRWCAGQEPACLSRAASGPRLWQHTLL
jgi:hypothetical protein